MEISSHVMLVVLSTGSVQRTKVDRETTQEVTNSKHAEHGAGTVTKNLWPSYVLRAVQSATSTFENYHKTVTFPYHGIRGMKLLPSIKFIEHSSKLAQAKRALEDALSEIAPNDAAYGQILDACKRSRGDWFDPDDYPKTAAEFVQEFVLDVDYIPVAAGDHVLTQYRDVLQGGEEEIVKRTEERMEKSMTEGVSVIFERFRRPLRRIVDVLSADTEKRVYVSMVDDVKGLIEMVPVFNSIIKDPRLDSWHAELQSLLDMNADHIRNSGVEIRKARAKQASDLLKKLDSYMS